MATEAFNLAEQFQTLVFVMSDLDLGMNNWMSDPFEYPEKPIDRGKVLEQGRSRPAGRISRVTRMWTATASAIARCRARTIRRQRISRAAAGTMRSRNTASGRTITKTTWSAWTGSLRRRARLFRGRRSSRTASRKIGIIAYGTSHWAIIESRDQMRKEYKLETDYLRLQGVSVHARSARLHRAARARVRGRAESRRADAEPAEARYASRS